jgi:hypothetical protein
LVQQFVDAALKLALLDFAPSQPFVEIADGGIREVIIRKARPTLLACRQISRAR